MYQLAVAARLASKANMATGPYFKKKQTDILLLKLPAALKYYRHSQI